MCLRIDIGCETDIDFYEMNKILMNHDSILYFKKIVNPNNYLIENQQIRTFLRQGKI